MPDLILHLTDPETGETVPHAELADDAALALMERAEITAAELVPWGSNHTFAVALEAEDAAAHLAIYKPIAGERPLRDFPFGTLHERERASYLLSRALGWQVVPPTIIRSGPYGEGSVQIYIEADPAYTENDEYWGEESVENERIVLFDHLANNGDRKLTHLMVSTTGRPVGIDHGLTFHHQPKLRTVMWQFVDEPIREELLADVASLLQRTPPEWAELRALLSPQERDSLDLRIDELLTHRRYPVLDPNRNIPWGWW